jgi:DNA-binding NarL/FixJ family response regulator
MNLTTPFRSNARAYDDKGSLISPWTLALVRPFDLYLLMNDVSPREREMLCVLAEGKTKKDMASLYNLSANTAAIHKQRLMDKLNLHDTSSLIRMVYPRLPESTDEILKRYGATEREIEIFHLIYDGKQNKEIATDLNIAVGTATKHRDNLMDKLNVSHIGALMIFPFEIDRTAKAHEITMELLPRYSC